MTGRGAAWGPTALVTVATLVAGVGCAPAEQRPATRASPEARRTVRLPGGTTVRVRAVGTRRDGRLAVPDDVRTAGWWRGGSRVGDPFGAVDVAGAGV